MVKFFKDETGAAAVEYGLLVGLIAVTIIGSVNVVGTRLDALFTIVADQLQNAVNKANSVGSLD